MIPATLIFQDRLPIAPDDDFGSLYNKLKTAGAALALRTVAALAAGTAPSLPQPELADARPAPKLLKETGLLDFQRPAAALVHWVRGLAPVPTAFVPLPDGRILKVFRAQATPAETPAPPGTWDTDGKKYLRVAAAGWLAGAVGRAARRQEADGRGRVPARL